MKQDFKEDFKEMISLIQGDKPFAFSRFADGEIGVMKGRLVNGSDKWISPNFLTKLGEDLLEAIQIIDKNVYFGISCQCCDIEGRDYLLGLIKNYKSNITFSNLFVNGNYSNFIEFTKTLNQPVNLIANHSTNIDNFPFKISTFLPVPDDCVNYWEQVRDDFKELLTNSYKDIKGELFFISAGPMSEAIIKHLWEINPENKYIDVGSSISEFVHGHPIREFAYTQSPYHNKNCVF